VLPGTHALLAEEAPSLPLVGAAARREVGGVHLNHFDTRGMTLRPVHGSDLRVHVVILSTAAADIYGVAV
jgi:hypothetical protein